MNNETKIGVVFLIFVGALVWLTVTMRGCPLTPKTQLRIEFRSLEGLKQGDDIVYSGVPIGKIRAVELSLAGGIAVCDLERDLITRDGAMIIPQQVEAWVEDTSVLGGKRIVMDPIPQPKGAPHVPIDLNHVLQGYVRESVVREASKVASNLAKLTSDDGAITRIAKNLEAASDDLAHVFGRIRQGKGTIGQLLKDERVYENANRVLNNLATITDSVLAGDGVLGRLLVDPKAGNDIAKALDAIGKPQGTIGKLLYKSDLHDSLASAAARFDRLLAAAERGDSTIGLLLSDRRLYDSAANTAENLELITDRLREGKGSVGKALVDEELYDNLRDITRSFKDIAAKIGGGEGTIGKLVYNDDLYEKAEEVIDQASEVLGDFSRFRVFGIVGAKYHTKQDLAVYRLGLRVEPSPDRFFYAGVAIMTLSKDGDIQYEGQFDTDTSDDTFLKPEFLAGFRFFDRTLTFKVGFIEGKFGGGLDLDFRFPGLEEFPMRFSVYGRLPYNDNDFDDDDINEDVEPFVLRAEFSFMVIERFRFFVGAHNFFDSVGVTFGASFEYRDDDISALVGFLALGT